ncbi:MAG: hypothetical protein K9M07_03020 [Simkaniaceae bacterium]|nr:hypothetical protein [Simkaniaceae bacterium]
MHTVSFPPPPYYTFNDQIPLPKPKQRCTRPSLSDVIILTVISIAATVIAGFLLTSLAISAIDLQVKYNQGNWKVVNYTNLSSRPLEWYDVAARYAGLVESTLVIIAILCVPIIRLDACIRQYCDSSDFP